MPMEHHEGEGHGTFGDDAQRCLINASETTNRSDPSPVCMRSARTCFLWRPKPIVPLLLLERNSQPMSERRVLVPRQKTREVSIKS